jgi:hypothetical protein
VFELVDGHMGGEVVDAVQRLTQTQGVRLGGGHTDEQRARQAGARGDRDRVDVLQVHSGLGQRPVHGRGHRLQMGAGGDLGHHAAEPGVLIDAGGDRVGEEGPAADHAHAGLVAGRLDAQHQWFVPHVPTPRRTGTSPGRGSRTITIASTPDGW